MNADTWTLVEDITSRVQRAVRTGDYPAILGLQGDQNLFLSDYPYLTSWATALEFEIRAAATAKAIHTHRWLLAVPQVWYDDGEIIQARPLYTAPLQPGETETISWMSYDATDGVDYGRVEFARRPDGQPVFDDLEYFTSPVQPLPRHPGGALHRLLVADIDLSEITPSLPTRR